MSGLRIGVLGGVPPALGGSGLELQIERTAGALAAAGHDVSRVETAPAGTTWDVVHAFGSEGNVHFALEHWRRAPAPLVLSPVLVASPGVSELALVATSRLPAPVTHARMRALALRRADVLVALTAYERRLLRRIAGRATPIEVVPNGADPVAPAAPDEDRAGYALLLGAVSARKRQRPVIEAIGGAVPVVVAGGMAADGGEEADWRAFAARTGTTWLGHVAESARVSRLLTDALALVHLAGAEGQSLAVLEALALGVPVVVSDIPSHRELQQRHPAWVHVVDDPGELPAVLARLRSAGRPATAPAVDSWADVAARLTPVYARLASARS